MEAFHSLTCPHCGGPLPERQVQTTVQCSFCGITLDLNRTLCPGCGTLNLEEERFCSRCGTAIVRACPACSHENWAGAEHCVRCGRKLDLLAIMTQERVRDTRARLRAQQREALLIKQREAAQSEARLAQMWKLEKQRQQEMAERNKTMKTRERRAIGVALLVVAVIILVAAVATLLWMLVG